MEESNNAAELYNMSFRSKIKAEIDRIDNLKLVENAKYLFKQIDFNQLL